MFVSCPTCSQTFEIPDSKIPGTSRFGVKCPTCREKIVVESKEAKDQPSQAQAPAATKKRPAIEPDLFPPGSQVVFSFVQSGVWNGALETFFSSEGYYLSKASDVEEAILKLRLNEYQVVIVDDRYANAPLLQEIGTWAGFRRRRINVLLLGDATESMSPYEAFRRGVNAYLNINDIDRAKELFEESLRGFKIHNEPWTLSEDSRIQ
jgi:predicted Zn finger-like uncharacterized protein